MIGVTRKEDLLHETAEIFGKEETEMSDYVLDSPFFRILSWGVRSRLELVSISPSTWPELRRRFWILRRRGPKVSTELP